jgi:hypothetical protein
VDGDWWNDNIVEPGKLPMLLCLAAFVITFLLTRVITRMIRAGIGPFRNNVSSSGLHIHHAVPGILLLIVGALMAIRGPDSPWLEIAGVIIGIGTSLILDEFALILHLEDVYWSDEGRISVELAGLTAACIGFIMLGFSPLGVDDLTVGELQIRVTLIAGLVIHALLVTICLLKGKYRAALISCFVPFVAWVTAVRLARPNSIWARRRYTKKKEAKAIARAAKFDRRWDPKWRWLSDMIAGAPSEPDPPERGAAPADSPSTDSAPATLGGAPATDPAARPKAAGEPPASVAPSDDGRERLAVPPAG